MLFALLGAFFYLPFLGGVHLFDWDEINFAEISREMLLLKDYLRVHVNFLPFWEKPPFFFWMQVLAMKVFGIGEFSARLPNAISGIATIVLLYNIGSKLYNHRFGVIWALAYFGSVLPFLYFKSGIIDPVFNLFIFIGLYFFILFYWKKEGVGTIQLSRSPTLYLFLAGFFIGMGILTKGQVAFLIAALTIFVYWSWELFKLDQSRFYTLMVLLVISYLSQSFAKNMSPQMNLIVVGIPALLSVSFVFWLFWKNAFFVTIPQLIFFTLAATIVTLTWYGLETWKNGPWFIAEFNKYQYRLFSTPDAGHKGFPGYHFVVLLVGCFPASIFAIRSFFSLEDSHDEPHQIDFRRWMKYLFWVVLILFTVVKSKIVHYSSMCYFPLSFLSALVIYQIIEGKIPMNNWLKTGLIAIGGLFILATLSMPLLGQNIELIKPLFSKDPFAMANLEANVNWSGWEVIPGVFLIGVIFYVLRALNHQQKERGFTTLFLGTSIFVMLTLVFFIGRIEGYSQRAAMEFYQEKAGEDCYIISHGYKTYGHLFYAQKPIVLNEKSYDKNWLLHGEVDKAVYVITKIHRAEELRGLETLEEITSKNGFVFFRRKERGITN